MRGGACAAIMRFMIAQVRGAARTLALGYVLFFWSERAFWSFFRPDDTLREVLITWFAYSLLGAVVSALVRTYRVSAWEPLFLVGAVYGWLAEGGIVDTMYGGPGGPFPLSLSFTGLAWHAMLTVGLGWRWFGLGLASGSVAIGLRRAVALGVGWGLWAIWIQNEAGTAYATTPVAFLGHAAAFSVPLAVAWWVLGRLGPSAAPPSVRERAAPAALVVVFLAAVRFPATPIAAPILLPLLLLCLVGLRRSVRGADAEDVIAQTCVATGASRYLIVLAIPVCASLVYAGLSWTRAPTNLVLYVVTTPLGFWHLGRSLWIIWRRGSTQVDVRRRSNRDRYEEAGSKP